MHPMYRFMDSYPQPHPYHGNQTHHPHYYHPSWEGIPPQMKVDPGKLPGGNEPWSYGCSYGYPNPMECHGCCHNMCPPGYYSYRPPHPHPHPSPTYYHGPYPSHPDFYPAYHRHYSMEQPRYEYDRGMDGKFCCGCPNHAWDQKEGNKGVKIEEHDPETDTKESGSSGPVNLKTNHPPYPFVWIPPEYMKDKGTTKSTELGPKVLNGWFPFDRKNDKETEKPSEPSELKGWNGWFPFDVNNIKSLKQSGDYEKNEKQQGDERKEQYPFPMIWIPSYDKPEDAGQTDQKECNNSPGEDLPTKLKIIPVNSLNSDRGNKSEILEDALSNGVDPKIMEKEMKQRNGSLERTGENITMKSPEETAKTVKNIPVKQQESEKTSSGKSVKSAKNRSPSPQKASKLPPVCLRVDPLPRKKSRNTSSRSPSPPGLKTQTSPTVADKMSQDSSSKEPVQSKAVEVRPMKEVRVIDIEDGKTGHNKEAPARNHNQSEIQTNIPVVPSVDFSTKVSIENGENRQKESNIKEGKGSVEATERKTNDEKKPYKEFSSAEAAVLIQSAYRGFEVRRWEPLTKLRQIARVREQVDKIREQIHALETMKDEKQRVVIGETIMSLLLQLDTIQGLHASVRDIRKSVARELVCLQEKLDSLATPKPEEIEEAKVSKPDESNEEKLKETVDGNEQVAELMNAEHIEKPCEEAVDDSSLLVEPIVEKESQQASTTKVDDQPSVRNEVGARVEIDVVKESPESSDVTLGDTSLDANAQPKLARVNLKDGVKDEDSILEDSREVTKTVKEVPESTEEFSWDSQKTEKVIECRDSQKTEELRDIPQNVSEVPETEKVNRVSEAAKESSEPPQNGNEVIKYTDLSEVLGRADLELGGAPKEDQVCESVVEGSSAISEAVELPDADKPVEPDPSLLAKLPLEVVEELAPTSNSHNLESEFRKDEISVSKDLLETPCVEEECKEQPMGVSPPLPIPALAEEEKALEETTSTHMDNHSSLSEGAALIVTTEDTELSVEDDKDASNTSILEEAKASGVSEGNVEETCWDSETMQYRTYEVELKEAEAEEKEREATVYSAPVAENPEAAEDDSLNPLPKQEMGEIKDNMLVEENEKLREMVEKLVEAGKQQLAVISDLNGRVKDMEKKLINKKKKPKTRRPRVAAVGTPCTKLASSNQTNKKVADCCV